MLGKIESKRRQGQQRMTWLDSITHLMDMNLTKLQEMVDRGFWHATGHRVTKSCRQLSNWTTRTNSIRSGEGGEEREKTVRDIQSLMRWSWLSTCCDLFSPLIIWNIFPSIFQTTYLPHFSQPPLPQTSSYSMPGLYETLGPQRQHPNRLRRAPSLEDLVLPASPSFSQPLPPVMASVSKITLGTDKALVTRGNQLPLDRKWLSIIS